MTAIPFSQTDAQHIDTDESDLEAYRAKLGNTGSRRLDTSKAEPAPAVSPFKLVQSTSPATAYKIKAGHCAATGRRIWEFYRSGIMLAVIDTSMEDTADLEAELLAFYPILKMLNRGDIVEVYPRVQITFVAETFPKPRNKVTALEVMPLDDEDRGSYFVQELKALAFEQKLLNSDSLPIIRAHVIDKGRRATQTDYEAARTALNALATKKEEDKLSKKPTQPEYVSPSVANADTPMFAQKPASELDAAFPRDEQNKPADDGGNDEPPKPPVDELTGKADGEPPKHWANEGWWNAKLNKEVKATVRETAMMPDDQWRDLAHTLLGRALRMEVKSFKDVDPAKVDGESALKAITAELEIEYGVKPPEPEQKIVRRTDPAEKAIPYWENPEAIARIKHELESTGLPEVLRIAPSDVMTAAYKTAGVKDMAEWAQGGGNTGKQFYQYVVKKWEAEIADDAPEQPVQAPSTSTEPPTTPDTTQTTHSAPAVNGNGQSSPKPEIKPDTQTTALTIAKSQQIEVSFTGRALLPSEQEWRTMSEMAAVGFKSGLLKGVKSLEAAKFIVETGRELGVPPSLALRKMFLIYGQVSMATELMWALVLNSGKLEDFEIIEESDKCTVMVKRTGRRPYTTVFSIEMAKRMMTKEEDETGNKKSIPLAEKYNWRQMPGVMCKWRALSTACRTVFPDVTLGLYSKEEMDDPIDFNADPDSVKTA